MNYLAIFLPLILATIPLLINHYGQPPTNLKPKIFVLGLSKTGTTSVGNALALLGYKRLGWKDIRSRYLVHTFINGDIDSVIDQTQYYDAFEDLPWPHMYRQMAEMYPDAKFVLSLRKNEQTWLRSMERHMGRGVWQPAAYFYGAQFVKGNEETVLNAYRNHTTSVREYFQDKPGRYAELVVDDGDLNWKVLCSVAQCPQGGVPTVSFPRSNTAADWHDDNMIVSFFPWLWGWTLGRIEELTSHYYYKRSWPMVNMVLEKLWALVSVIDMAVSQLYFNYMIESQEPLPVSR